MSENKLNDVVFNNLRVHYLLSNNNSVSNHINNSQDVV